MFVVCSREVHSWVHKSVREELLEFHSLLLPCGSRESSSGHQPRQQAPDHGETSNHLLSHIVLTSLVYPRRKYLLLFKSFNLLLLPCVHWGWEEGRWFSLYFSLAWALRPDLRSAACRARPLPHYVTLPTQVLLNLTQAFFMEIQFYIKITKTKWK